jgi:hypothetical protein
VLPQDAHGAHAQRNSPRCHEIGQPPERQLWTDVLLPRLTTHLRILPEEPIQFLSIKLESKLVFDILQEVAKVQFLGVVRKHPLIDARIGKQPAGVLPDESDPNLLENVEQFLARVSIGRGWRMRTTHGWPSQARNWISGRRCYPICLTTASPNSLHLSSVAPCISRSKS